MTGEGHAALEAELKNLRFVERPAIIQAISVAREHGDLWPSLKTSWRALTLSILASWAGLR